MTVHFTATFESIAIEAKFRIRGAMNRSIVLSNLQSLEILQDGKAFSVSDHMATVRFIDSGLRDNALRYRSENGIIELNLLVFLNNTQMDEVFDIFIKALEGESYTAVVEFAKEAEDNIDESKGPKDYSLEYVKLSIKGNNGGVILKSFF